MLIATPLQFLQALWTGPRGGKRVIVGVAPESSEALDELREMIEAGAIRTVISRRFLSTRSSKRTGSSTRDTGPGTS
jgi:hypothetical protein